MVSDPPSLPVVQAEIRFLIADRVSILRITDDIEALLGHPAPELLAGRPRLQDLRHPDDQDLAQALLSPATAESQSEGAVHLRLRHADGRIRCLQATYRRSPNASGDGVVLDLRLQDVRSLPRTLDDPTRSPMLRAMMANSDEILYFKDRHHVYVAASQALVGLCAGARHGSDLIGRTDYELFTEDHADRGYRLERQILAGQAVVGEIQPVRWADGTSGWIDQRQYPIHDDSGAIIGLYGLARDITAQKQAEAALTESRERLELAAVHNGIGIWDWNLQTMTLVWDESMFALYRKRPDEFSGTHDDWQEVVHPEDRARMQHETELALLGRKSLNSEFRILWPTGEVRRIKVAAKLFRDADGTPQRLLGTNIDITGQYTNAVDLAQRERQLRFVLEGSELGFWDWDIRSGKVERNERWATMLGYSHTEIQQTPRQWTDFIHPEDRERAWTSIRDVLEGRSPSHRVEYRMLHKDGRVRWILDQARVMEWADDGQPIRMCGTHTDISERKSLEAQLLDHQQHLESLVEYRTLELMEAKQQAEEANAAKSRFLANMSHEIRTPLNAVLGLVHLMRREGVTPAQADRLGKIEVAGHHLLDIINAILDLSKIESGKFTLEETQVDVAAIMRQLVSMLSDRVEAKQLSLRVRLQPLPSNLLGDPVRIQQALLNYATNAVKFTETGAITLGARLEVDRGDSVVVHFEVEDTGIGIGPEQLSRLFNDFEQADASITRQYGGTGLGLALTKRLAQLMGGEAGVSSSPGVGSRFWFSVRLRRDREATPQAPSRDTGAQVRPWSGAGRHVLLVEDEPINREVALGLLADLELIMDTAEDGAQAVELARHRAYDLILMDMQMPVMDGLEATRRIRRLPLGARVPIVAMTANAFAEDRARCFEAGMDDFMGKPVDPDLLYKILGRWLATRTART